MKKFCEQCNKEFFRGMKSSTRKRHEALTTFSKRRFCSTSCMAFDRETKIKAGIILNPNRYKFPTGESHYRWKGGITAVNDKIRHSSQYKEWRKAVFTRDDYTCIWCNKRNGNGNTIVLNADHIKEFADFPELRFKVSNGRTLCFKCHRTRNKFHGNQYVSK